MFKKISYLPKKAKGTRFLLPSNRREFQYSNSKYTNYGLIGLGQMGFNMAKNLRSNLSASDSLYIFDVNHEPMNRFIRETKDFKNGPIVYQAINVSEAADNSVRCLFSSSYLNERSSHLSSYYFLLCLSLFTLYLPQR